MAVGSDRFSLLFDSVASDCSTFRDLLAAVGVVVIGGVVVKICWNVGRSIWVYFGTSSNEQRKRLLKYGQWAVIYGCSGKLGHQFAEYLSSCGLDLILIGPATDKEISSKLADDLTSKYNVQCVQINVSVNSVSDLTFCDDIMQSLENKDVGILINNLHSLLNSSPSNENENEGCGNFVAKLTSELAVVSTMTVNVVETCFLLNNRGLVVFVSSEYEKCRESRDSCLQNAAKSYIRSLSKELHQLVRSKNIFVQTLTPGRIHTDDSVTCWNWFGKPPNLLCPTVPVYTSWAFLTLGRSQTTFGYLPHALHGYLRPFEFLACFCARHVGVLRNCL